MANTQRLAARRSKPNSSRAWIRQHRDSVRETLANLRSSRSAVALSVLVIGFTLAFPLGLHVLQQNFLNVVITLGSQPHATLFLEGTTSEAQAESIVNSLRSDPRMDAVRVIDKDTALAEFARTSNLGEVLDTLAENPLPYTIVMAIDASEFEGTKGQRLQNDLNQIPNVAHTQFDVTWIRRLDAVSNLAARAALAFGAILGIGVVLITGNTIRVGIQGRRDEIEVAKLCGATDAYVRRPFLYSGALQGLLGAFVAVALVASAIALLSGPTGTLTALYSSNMQLVNISMFSLISVLCVGAALGLIGAWIAVSAYLRQVDVTRSV